MRQEICFQDGELGRQTEEAPLAAPEDIEGRETSVWYQGLNGWTYRGKKIPRIKRHRNLEDGRCYADPLLDLDVEPSVLDDYTLALGLHPECVGFEAEARSLLLEVGREATPEKISLAEAWIRTRLSAGSKEFPGKTSLGTPDFRDFWEGMLEYGIQLPRPEKPREYAVPILPRRQELQRRYAARR